MRYASLFLVAALILCVAGPVVAGQSKEAPKDVKIDGVWSMTVSTPQGDRTDDATFKQDKDKIKVTMAGMGGMTLEGEGIIKDGTVEWGVSIDTPNGTFSLVFKGKIDGDKMAGDVAMGDFGTAPWSAVRKK